MRLGWLATVAVLQLSSYSHAAVQHSCRQDFVTSHPNGAYVAPGATVDVWLTTYAPYSIQTASGLSSNDLWDSTKRALQIWNEQSGGKTKLRFRGYTGSTYINGAVVILGNNQTCGQLESDDPRAEAEITLAPILGVGDHAYHHANVIFYDNYANN